MSLEKRIEELLARMTLPEKIGQMAQISGADSAYVRRPPFAGK